MNCWRKVFVVLTWLLPSCAKRCWSRVNVNKTKKKKTRKKPKTREPGSSETTSVSPSDLWLMWRALVRPDGGVWRMHWKNCAHIVLSVSPEPGDRFKAVISGQMFSSQMTRFNRRRGTRQSSPLVCKLRSYQTSGWRSVFGKTTVFQSWVITHHFCLTLITAGAAKIRINQLRKNKRRHLGVCNGFTSVLLQQFIIILSMNHFHDKLSSSQNPLRVPKPQISSWLETKAAIFSLKKKKMEPAHGGRVHTCHQLMVWMSIITEF